MRGDKRVAVRFNLVARKASKDVAADDYTKKFEASDNLKYALSSETVGANEQPLGKPSAAPAERRRRERSALVAIPIAALRRSDRRDLRRERHFHAKPNLVQPAVDREIIVGQRRSRAPLPAGHRKRRERPLVAQRIAVLEPDDRVVECRAAVEQSRCRDRRGSGAGSRGWRSASAISSLVRIQVQRLARPRRRSRRGAGLRPSARRSQRPPWRTGSPPSPPTALRVSGTLGPIDQQSAAIAPPRRSAASGQRALALRRASPR